MPRPKTVQDYLELFPTLSEHRQDAHLRAIIRYLLVTGTRKVTQPIRNRT